MMDMDFRTGFASWGYMMSSAIDQDRVNDLSSWDSAGKIQSITPKASQPPKADTKGKNWAKLKGCVCLGR